MSVVLSEHLPLLAGAPDGIQKLRGLILELAVRGKLVPQDPKDEPASELLKRVAKERVRLEAAGTIKKTKPLPLVKGTECPFDVPNSWAWTRLGEITNFGQTEKDGEIRDTTWVLDLEDIQKDTSVLLRKVRFAERQAKSDKNRFQQGDVLYGKLRPYLNKVIVADEEGVCTTEIIPVRGYYGVFPRYLMHAVKRPDFLAYVNSKSYGMKMPRLGTDDGRLALFPLPPEKEQHRIVAKVDELMALCDRLEAEVGAGDTAHAKLVEALLGTLTQSTDAADLGANWQRLAEHFDTLFATESSLDALKQTILQLAVMGKLVPQDPNDAPICGKLGDFVEFLNGYAFKSEWFTNAGVRLLRNTNVAHGSCDWKDAANVSIDRLDEFKKFQLNLGDLVLSLDRPIINTGLKIARITENDLPCLLLQRVAKVSPLRNAVVTDYLFQWFNSPAFTRTIDPGRSNGVPHISTKQVADIPFTRYSTAEQHRIVAKVDELMALCDRLKADLAESRTRQTRLSATLIESALQAA